MKEKEDTQKPPRVRDLFVWKSPSRPSIDYPKGSFITLGGIITLLTVIFVLFQEWLAIAVTWAAYFLFFTLSRLPKIEVEHKITTEGLVSLDRSYIWLEFGPFWFTTSASETILHIAHRGLFNHLTLVINKEDQDKITEILAEYLPFIETPEKSAFEKFTDWFNKKFSK